MNGSFIATREYLGIHIYRYENPALRCIHRIVPDGIYIDEDPDTHSKETKCATGVKEVVLTDHGGSLLVRFEVGLPNETSMRSYGYGVLHYYTLNGEG